MSDVTVIDNVVRFRVEFDDDPDEGVLGSPAWVEMTRAQVVQIAEALDALAAVTERFNRRHGEFPDETIFVDAVLYPDAWYEPAGGGRGRITCVRIDAGWQRVFLDADGTLARLPLDELRRVLGLPQAMDEQPVSAGLPEPGKRVQIIIDAMRGPQGDRWIVEEPHPRLIPDEVVTAWRPSVPTEAIEREFAVRETLTKDGEHR